MVTIALFTLTLLSASMSCSPDNKSITPDTDPPVSGGTPNPIPGQEPSTSDTIQITIGATSFTITLADNATARAFKELLPMSINMSEMNGNEKYYYLPVRLSTAASNPGTIQTGDLMLYGSTCVVLFYKTFSTSYSYTRLGRVNNPSGLAAALGSGDVTVTFKLQEK